jgi:hypothetical protein
MNVPQTGAWESFTTIQSSPVYMSQGPHVLRLSLDTNASNGYAASLDWIEVVTMPPATVMGATVNGGGTQRSRVETLEVEFSEAVTVDSGAFEVRNAGTSAVVTTLVSTQLVAGNTVATLSFSGNETQYDSLKDGRYQLTVYGNKVHAVDSGLDLDGDGDGVAGGNYVFADDFYRYFGDNDCDGDVDMTDFLAFRGSMNKSSGEAGFLWQFDVDNDGDVDMTDFFACRLHMNQSLP